MRTLLGISIFIGCLFFTITILGYFFWYQPRFASSKTSFKVNKDIIVGRGYSSFKKVKSRAFGLKKYCNQKKYNSSYCFMIDMGIPSGKQRFFVYNLKKDSIEMAGLVTHGAGSVTASDELFFSNETGSGCTSLGKYKIGKPYTGRFGLAYKLYGLENTNSKAFERFVVLHAHSCVPAREVYPLSICPSLGCPTVAPDFLQKLTRIIDVSDSPILLEIYQ